MAAAHGNMLRNFNRRQEELMLNEVEPAENFGIDPAWTLVQRIIAKAFVESP